MGKVKKLSVSVDADSLDELRKLAPEVTISFLISDALKQKLTRLRLRALLDEMEAENPMTDEERRKGDALWEKTVSYWTPERSRRSPAGKDESAVISSAPSKTKRKSRSRPS
jgi:hypothetical protein